MRLDSPRPAGPEPLGAILERVMAEIDAAYGARHGHPPQAAPRALTLEETFVLLAEDRRWAWIARWFACRRIVVAANGRVWQARSPDDLCPPELDALGCAGLSSRDQLLWLGWDLDVGHGKTAYASTPDAVRDGLRLRHALGGRAEVRYSKSGRGVHVRHTLASPLPAADGPHLARAVATRLGLRADPAALSRQCFWLWARRAPPPAFELIKEHYDG